MNDEHPHRCRAGHQWHHAGPTADVCPLPTGYAESGDPLCVGTDECPLCSGRDELLRRGPHEHQCPVCLGSWRHQGVCPEGPIAWCPWCIPVSGAPTAPGSRLGRHFHVCPRRARSWEHAHPCVAPLRAETAHCPGCRSAARPARTVRAVISLAAVAYLVLGLSLALRPSPRAPGRTVAADRAVIVQTSAAPETFTPRATDGPMPSGGVTARARTAGAASTVQRKGRVVSTEQASRRTPREAPGPTSGTESFAPFIAVLDAARSKLVTLIPGNSNAVPRRGGRGFADTPVSER